MIEFVGKPIIISLGGSLIIPNGGVDHQFLKTFREVIIKFVEKGFRFFIIAGGGKTCRNYQEAARQVVELSSEDIDWLGIHTTHLNGHLLRTIFRGYSYPKVLTHYAEKEDVSEPIVIAAGWKPGHSTDYDAVSFAKLYNCDTVLNLSDIPFVYDKDPDKFPDAKPLREISWKDFQKIVGDTWDPGLNAPFDPGASKLAAEASLKVVVMNGHNLQNFENYLEGKDFEGTVIS
jgi:uridylate kinase